MVTRKPTKGTELAVIDEGSIESAIAAIDSGTVDSAAILKLVAAGDISKLAPNEKLQVYVAKAQLMKIDPRVQPFDIIPRKNRDGEITSETLYPNARCANELRRLHSVSFGSTSLTFPDKDHVMAEVVVKLPSGRTDTDIGVVKIGDKGFTKADAIMKAVTKAKRRATFSILGMPQYADDHPTVEVLSDDAVSIEPQYMTASEITDLIGVGEVAGFALDEIAYVFSIIWPNQEKDKRLKLMEEGDMYNYVISEFSDPDRVAYWKERYARTHSKEVTPPGLD